MVHPRHDFFATIDYMEQNPEHPLVHKLFLLFILVLFLNILVLDFVLIKKFPTILRDPLFLSQTAPTPSSRTTQLACPQSCLEKIDTEITNLSQSATSSSQTSQPAQAPAANQVKEFFITVGSGAGSSDNWQNVPGLQVTIDASQYGKIKNVYFEVSAHVPNTNQIVYARLYDVTDDHPVWYSEMTFTNAGVAQTQTSAPLIFPEGKKTYAVQMKTQLKYPTNITSRIRIDTD